MPRERIDTCTVMAYCKQPRGQNVLITCADHSSASAREMEDA
jgi:hypothetical protein